MTKLSIGYSPCPNDTFIFYALAHKKLKRDLEFSEILMDVEGLNKLALKRGLDVAKASFYAFGFLRENYCLLHSGSALGRGCGPLIVAKNKRIELARSRIAIPGRMTTAYLLLQLFNPEVKSIVEMPFDRIMSAVSLGTVDAGLLIHEGRFTYPKYNLVKLVDLGAWWEEETGLPVPLGGILAKRELGKDMIRKIDSLVKKSVEYAFQNRAETKGYIKHNAQELDDEVIEQHIRLYVNDYTLDIGDGIVAIEKLLKTAEELNLIPHSDKPVFID